MTDNPKNIFLLSIVVILLVILAVTRLYNPIIKNNKEIQKELLTIKNQIIEARKMQKNLAILENEYQKYKKLNDKINSYLFFGGEVDFFKIINDSAKTCSLKINRISPKQTDNDIKEYNVSINGAFEKIYKFLKISETWPENIIFDKMDLYGQNNGILSGNIIFKVRYIKR